MLKGENIICISSIDWDFNWQGHQEIMSVFACNGNRVLFIENTGVRPPMIRDLPRIKKRLANWIKGVKGIRKEMENLYIFSPLALPFPYSRIARWINRFLLLPILERWMKVMNFTAPVIWTFLPTGTALDLINNLNKKLVIYYCIAEFAELIRKPKKIKMTERELLRKADIVFAQGQELKDYCKKYNDNVTIFPFGVRLNIFEHLNGDLDLRLDEETPDDLKDTKKPIVGYIGGLHRHIDFRLIEFLAKGNPNWSIVLVGPIQTNTSNLKKFSNIFLLGEKSHSDLPNYINEFDVCLIPYLKSNYTETVYPTKLNEYLALGKPVVSTDLPEVEIFNEKYGNIVYVGRDDKEFAEYVEKAIKEDNRELKKRRIEVARENSWENRIEQMSDLIQKAIQIKMSDREARWKENLISFYRMTRRKFARFGVICLLTYLLLFKTPFIWFLAAPLKITDTPQETDAIVVFAGGVGESGKAGQGYEERVQYAVELYKKGYAPSLIFSSGYVYVLREAEVMKALAVSMGVPENVILLEEKATNTYENVKFSKEILENNGWNSALLISSPYHMCRASLVFRKIAKDIKVTYAPIPHSLFYSGKEGVKLSQIQGITHEYLGIIYYWLKGYI